MLVITPGNLRILQHYPSKIYQEVSEKTNHPKLAMPSPNFDFHQICVDCWWRHLAAAFLFLYEQTSCRMSVFFLSFMTFLPWWKVFSLDFFLWYSVLRFEMFGIFDSRVYILVENKMKRVIQFRIQFPVHRPLPIVYVFSYRELY